jgi:hypothetical protein
MVAAAAWVLGFFAAARKAFVADGAENNWTLHRQLFSSFVPILDFIPGPSYVFAAASRVAVSKRVGRCMSGGSNGHYAAQVRSHAGYAAELACPATTEAERSLARQLIALASAPLDWARYPASRCRRVGCLDPDHPPRSEAVQQRVLTNPFSGLAYTLLLG